MAYLSPAQSDELNKKMSNDNLLLGKMYRSRSSHYMFKVVDHSLADYYIGQGWEELNSLKTKTRLRKRKSYSKIFEDEMWCQLYDLGYRMLNIDENFHLPFSKNSADKKQIDVVATDHDSIIIVECKSSEQAKKAPSYKDEFDVLSMRLSGFIGSLKELFGEEKKVKYIFATRNLRISEDSEDIQRLKNTHSFYYNDNTYDYVKNLISKYKKAARYQFLGLLFKNELINKEKIEIPALYGKMGGKSYYIFSIEPTILLKLGFVLHRTKANVAEFPTYQRLLVPGRMNAITKYIDDGGFFPNSIIINFDSSKNKLLFEPHSKSKDSSSRTGILKIPNIYGTAYIIDGQHRVYGYANSKFVNSNTIPVVAFDNLETSEQLEMFMDINQNQKAVSPSLRLDLEEDLYWNSERADSRLKALRSSIIKQLTNSVSSPLYNKISVGEDTALLAFKPFATSISSSGLLPVARGNKYDENSLTGSLYDTSNHDHNREMLLSKKRVVNFLIGVYDFVSANYPAIFNDAKSLIISNRGTYAFINLIGSLNTFETAAGRINRNTELAERMQLLDKYLTALLDQINEINIDEKTKLLESLGAGADIEWLRFFQTKINRMYPEYNPAELVDWEERQDEELQEDGRKYIVKIEKYIKNITLNNLRTLYQDNWELEINSIKRECLKRAEEEMERNYKEGLGNKKIEWTDMFTISDYKNIITSQWVKTPKDAENGIEFNSFEKYFSIDIGEGFNSKSEKTKWISYLNLFRNKIAHEGTKGGGLNREEVNFLKGIAKNLNLEL